MAARIPVLAVAIGAFGIGVFATRAEAQAPAAMSRDLSSISQACGTAAWAEAVKLGATAIQSTIAGPAKRDRLGRTAVPVRIQIGYPRFPTYEVKEAVITCTIDKDGRVIGAGTP